MRARCRKQYNDTVAAAAAFDRHNIMCVGTAATLGYTRDAIYFTYVRLLSRPGLYVGSVTTAVIGTLAAARVIEINSRPMEMNSAASRIMMHRADSRFPDCWRHERQSPLFYRSSASRGNARVGGYNDAPPPTRSPLPTKTLRCPFGFFGYSIYGRYG